MDTIRLQALEIGAVTAIPEGFRDYLILRGLLEGIAGLPAMDGANEPHTLGHSLGASIHAALNELDGRPSTMASAIRHDLQAQRDDAWRELAAMRQERDWLRSVTAGLVKG